MITDEFVVEKPSFVEIKLTGDNIILYDYLLEQRFVLNIVIDSLIGYWYVEAKKVGIDFSVNLNIPMEMPFRGADICLILGNLLENAVEAAQKAEGKKYIRFHMKYDKNNLLLFVENNYKGVLIKTKDKRLKSTKTDAGNHGVGLSSVYRIAAKYHGVVTIDDDVANRFLIRVVLYGKQE